MIPKYLYSSLATLALALWSWLLSWPNQIMLACLFMAVLFAFGTLCLSIIYYANLAVREALQYILRRDE